MVLDHHPVDIFDESVFAFIPNWNLDNFMNAGDKHLSSLVWHIVPLTACFHTGVGYCLFAFGQSRASVQINELLHTFFVCFAHRSKGEGHVMMMNNTDMHKEEAYVSPEMEVLQVALQFRLMEGTGNTEPIDEGGTVPGF